jgi:CrcB protein
MTLNIMMIALGAALGANLRYCLSLWAAQRFGTSFPYGTLIINVLGSFAIGIVLVLATTRLALSEPLRLLIVTGLLGGFTTFSSFSFEVYTLLTGGSWGAAALYVLGSFGLGMVGVFAGAGLARALP